MTTRSLLITRLGRIPPHRMSAHTRAVVFAVEVLHTDTPLTPDEIAPWLDLSPFSVRKAGMEAVDAGLLSQTVVGDKRTRRTAFEPRST